MQRFNYVKYRNLTATYQEIKFYHMQKFNSCMYKLYIWNAEIQLGQVQKFNGIKMQKFNYIKWESLIALGEKI